MRPLTVAGPHRNGRATRRGTRITWENDQEIHIVGELSLFLSSIGGAASREKTDVKTADRYVRVTTRGVIRIASENAGVIGEVKSARG